MRGEIDKEIEETINSNKRSKKGTMLSNKFKNIRQSLKDLEEKLFKPFKDSKINKLRSKLQKKLDILKLKIQQEASEKNKNSFKTKRSKN